jgi:hypothetical protein
LMAQFEVVDFSMSEPDLASIIKQIYGGALAQEQAGPAALEKEAP